MKTMITTQELATRWSMNPRTLENWRAIQKGPRFVRIGGKKILYRMKDVLAFEGESSEIQNQSVRTATDL